MPFTADQLFQTFPRFLRPLFATFSPFYHFFCVSNISCSELVDDARLTIGVPNIKEKNYVSDSFIVR